MQKQFWKIFKKKKMFLNFLSKKVTNFCSKKKIKKYIFFTKTNLEKAFFYKKQILKYFFGKKKFEIFFSLFSRGGGNYQANSGILKSHVGNCFSALLTSSFTNIAITSLLLRPRGFWMPYAGKEIFNNYVIVILEISGHLPLHQQKF
jgi:hypothetical protein